MGDADRVLILTHNDPDPDAMASGLALRTVLRRTRQTAVIGCLEPVTRPENLRMVKLLDLKIETLTPDQFKDFDKIALVDVQPHYFPGLLPHVDLVIDHHPRAVRLQRDLQGHPPGLRLDLDDPDRAPARGGHGHLGAHRHGDALRDQVRHAVLQPPRQPRRPRRVLVPLSARRRDDDPQDGGRGNHRRAPRLSDQGVAAGPDDGARVLRVPRRAAARRLHPLRRGLLPAARERAVDGDQRRRQRQFVVSVRNLGYSRNAGDFVRRWFSDIGSAGGHRTMAKAVVPLEAFQKKFGTYEGSRINQRMLELVLEFLHETKDK